MIILASLLAALPPLDVKYEEGSLSYLTSSIFLILFLKKSSRRN